MGTVDPRRPSLKSILKKTSKYDTHDEVGPEPTDTSDPPPAAGHRHRHHRDKHPHVSQLASMLKPTHDEEDSEDEVDTEPRTPKVLNKSTPGVSSAVDCFTEPPPTPLDSPLEDHEEELFNYQGQVVTRSAMELLEMEDEIAARGGLYERDGVVMTASALSLLQAQEAMARADTAGQGEWGPDEWDGIRGQYIPKWASLRPAHLALATSPAKPTLRPLTRTNEDGTRQEDWFEPDMDRIEERNLLRFGMEGVVDYNY
ncbi:hypothetical protein HD553DRAFT_346517 [Filobasidium floriforme]|uniref:uncharacterized protein n=1 Tax=Filobasidium floriforme TaxID=5210 RepID=UPI001E8EBCDE|nr:uncharacterized protein HD553DRAFT_346517 [Filobasidium floriforme]KAH8077859.1 hypothetical protein HD553DRAFT_346517 [Filobasidium floriforme]